MTRPLEDLCALITDGTHYTPPDLGEGVPFLTVKDVSEKGLDFRGCSRISQTDFAAAEAANSAPRQGDVLFSKDGTVGKVHVVETDQDFAVLSSLAILRPDPNEIDARYLGHMLKTPDVVGQATRRTTGSAIRRIVLKDLRRVELGVPSLDEQRRIAAILDQADAFRARRRQALAHLDDLTQSIFFDMFGDPSRWPDLWAMGTIGELAVSVNYGTSAKAGSSGRWPILRMGNLTDDGRLDLRDLKFIDLDDRDLAKYTVKPGDMLFNRTNSKEKVGKSAVVRTEKPLAVAGYLVRVRFENSATAEFVSAYLTSSHGLAVRQRMAKAAVNQANINANEMRKIHVAHPPAEAKREFERRILATDRQRAGIYRSLIVNDGLFASLQARAFRGQL